MAQSAHISFLPKHREAQAIIQNRSVLENATIAGLAGLTNRFGFVRRKQSTALAEGIIERLKIKAPGLNVTIDGLSGGNKQKILLGRLSLTKPRLVLLNEPTRGVDISAKPDILNLIRTELSKDAGVIMISESEEELIEICDRVLLFFKGQVVKDLKRGEAAIDVETIYKTTQGVKRGMTTAKKFLFLVLLKHLIWGLLAFLFIVGVTIPGFLSTRNILNVMWAAAPLGCMVLGLFFILLTANVDLSLESTFALAPTVAIVAFFQYLPFEAVPVVAVVATVLIGAEIGYLNGLFSVKFQVSSFLMTLGTMLLMRGILVYLIPEGVYYLPEGYIYLGANKLFGIFPVAVLVWITVFVLAWLIVERHRLGKDILALGNNEQAAFVAGVNIDRTKIICFVIAGALAALGGMLETGRSQSVVADMGEGDIMMVFAGTILGGTAMSGGKGNVGGVFAADLVIAIIENLMNLYGIAPSIRQVVFGAILLVAIYLASLQERLRNARLEA